MVAHVLGVPVILEPVLGGVFLHKITYSISEVIWFEQQQLNYEITNLGFISFMTTHGLGNKEKK